VQEPSPHTRLVLIRHGQSVDNVAGRISGWTDSALTQHGIEQARRTAEFVAMKFKLSAIYASTLRRAFDTASPLASLTGLPIVVREDLRELHFGAIEGLSEVEMRERYQDLVDRARDEDDELFAWPGGESRAGFFTRVQSAVADITRTHRGETIAVVSHGGVLSSLVAHVFEAKPSRWRRYLVSNCSVSELTSSDGRFTITQWNLVDHLR
jgi:broad specificity phosphatase PhoE